MPEALRQFQGAFACLFHLLVHFAKERQRAVEPMSIESFTVKSDATMAEIYERAPSSVPLPIVARINGVDVDTTIAKGRVIKRVRGFNPDFSSVAKSG